VGGAIVDSATAGRARAAGLDVERFLEANDTFAFHQALGTLIRTGPTHTNVRDLMVYVRSRNRPLTAGSGPGIMGRVNVHEGGTRCIAEDS
jgi:hypothetical protein